MELDERILGIKDNLINLRAYEVIDTTIKLFSTIKHLSKDNVRPQRLIKTLLTLVNSEYGPGVLKHLLEYGAYTYREIELTLGCTKSAILFITRRLESINLVEQKAVVSPPIPSMPGVRPMVWALKGALPEISIKCMKRYHELRTPEEIHVEEITHPEILEECLEYFRVRGETGLSYSHLPVCRYIIRYHPDIDGKDRRRIAERVRMILAKEPYRSARGPG